MKKIRQAEDKQNNAESQAQKSRFQDVYFMAALPGISTLWCTDTRDPFPVAKKCGKLPNALLSIFRPPQLG